MRSTEQSPLIISLRRAEIAAFWVLSAAVLSAALGIAAAALGAVQPWLWGAGGLCVLLPGVVWRPWFEWGVRGWNKGAKLLAAPCRQYALRVGYYTVFAVVGAAGTTLVASRPDARSRWVARSDERWDEGQTLGMSFGSGRNAWTICLAPLVLLLRLLREDGKEAAAPPSATYTLY